MIRLINVVAIALFIIITVISIKYKLVCEVTSNEEVLGYIADKEKFEQSVNEIINKEEENKLYTTITKIPQYNLKFVDKTAETNEEKVLAKIEESAETTYKFYAVTVDGKEKATIKNLDEAEKLVEELNNKYEEKTKIKIGIVEVITTDKNKNITTVKIAKKNITKEMDEKADELEIVQEATYTATRIASLNGIKLTVTPVSGVITSRFGGRESIRSSAHTGLDIAAPYGTPIKAAASGTVIFAGYSGGYGNLVKISHGNDIVTYYGHCSQIYVTEGQKISAGDTIAAVGSTGHSTGNHLHFEVVKDGMELNPENYLYR